MSDRTTSGSGGLGPPGTTTTDDVSLKAQGLFPRLNAKQMSRLARIGREHSFSDGEILFEVGFEAAPFFAVLEGAVEVFQNSTAGLHVVATHGPGGFTGDVSALSSSRRTVVAARARGPTRVVEVPNDKLRALLQTDAELGEIILRAFILRRAAMIVGGVGNMVLVGSAHSARTLQLREFLTRNDHPHQYLDIERDPAVQETLDRLHVSADEVPVLLLDGGKVLRNPTIEQLAACLGIDRLSERDVHDLVIIGAGPAGLAAAVYGASEGLDVLVLEASAPGGQAGSSSRIENYLGFPTGISGNELALAAAVQAEKFGAKLSVTRAAAHLRCDQRPYAVTLASGESIATRAIVVASGAFYRRIDIPDLDRFEGVGVYYGATYVEANLCAGDEVVVVGGGNSAGQAAVFLSARCSKVHLLVRGEGLARTMSRYLIRRIDETPNIFLRSHTEIVAMEGVDGLQRVTWRDAARGEQSTLEIRHVFLMIGADPNTKWLDGCLALDAQGFIKTGADLTPDDLVSHGWPLKRSPFFLESSMPGVFAAGDVRAQSVKRVAAAVGEGSGTVPLVHRVLAE